MRLINKISGINLVSLLIGSALGVFILSVIVQVSFTISSNYQVIKANTELSIAARLLNNFFTKIFSANGYIEYNEHSDATSITNMFTTDVNSKETMFDVKYSAGLDGAILCSGQSANATPAEGGNPNPPTYLQVILNNKPDIALRTQCKDPSLTGNNFPPIVSNKLFKNFQLIAVANSDSNNVSTNKINNIAINDINPSVVLQPANNSYGYAKGIKLAIILKSSHPAFNTPRQVTFKLFNNQEWTTNDKYLYRLMIVQAPFLYPALNTNNKTTVIKS